MAYKDAERNKIAAGRGRRINSAAANTTEQSGRSKRRRADALSSARGLALCCGAALMALRSCASAEAIALDSGNYEDYLTFDKGIGWLRNADGGEQNFVVTDFLLLQSLGLRQAKTEQAEIKLLVDTRSPDVPSPALWIERNLQLDKGAITVIAANPGRDCNLNEGCDHIPPAKTGIGFASSPDITDEALSFRQSGGTVDIYAADDAVGIEGNNNYRLEGGRFTISSRDDATGARITLQEYPNTDFRISGSETAITARDHSAGLAVSSLRMDGGALTLRASDNAKAIHIGYNAAEDRGGVFDFHSGLLRLENARGAAGDPEAEGCDIGSAGNYALCGDWDSRITFGADSVLQLPRQFAVDGQTAVSPISFSAAEIMPGAKLDMGEMQASGGYRLSSAAPLTVTFLESRDEAIKGEFTQMQAARREKLFYAYETGLSADRQRYQLRFLPKSAGGGAPLRVSDIMSGNNRRAAQALEGALAAAPQNAPQPYPELAAFYDRLYNSDSGAEQAIRGSLRRFSPSQATRLPALTLSRQEEFAAAMRDSFSQLLAPEAELTQTEAENAAASAENSASVWLRPTGGHDKYRAQSNSFNTLTADYGGLNIGAARKAGNSAFGLSAGFDSGRLHGEQSYRADMLHFMLGGGFAYAAQRSGRFRPVFDANFSYGNAAFKQERHDAAGMAHRARPRQNSFMADAALSQYFQPAETLSLAPQLGLDYAYIRQNGWTEKGTGWALRVKSANFNALRPKIGAKLLWDIAAGAKLQADAAYRYDLLDTNVNLDTQMRDAAAFAWRVKGEDTNRSSFRSGLKLAYQARANILLSGGYGITAQGKRSAQQLSARAEMKF